MSSKINDQEAIQYYDDGDMSDDEGDDLSSSTSSSSRRRRKKEVSQEDITVSIEQADESRHSQEKRIRPHNGDYMSGWLHLKGAFRWNKRFFRLKRTSLCYYMAEDDLKPLSEIYLGHASIWKGEADTGKRWSIQIFHPRRGTANVKAGNQKEMEQWIAILKERVIDIREEDFDYTSSSSDDEPGFFTKLFTHHVTLKKKVKCPEEKKKLEEKMQKKVDGGDYELKDLGEGKRKQETEKEEKEEKEEKVEKVEKEEVKEEEKKQGSQEDAIGDIEDSWKTNCGSCGSSPCAHGHLKDASDDTVREDDGIELECSVQGCEGDKKVKELMGALAEERFKITALEKQLSEISTE